jgi:uncharacterized LabA/DUF88 family protein
MAQDEKRIALLIDADNAPASKIDLILGEVARFGVAHVRRAYGNWKSPSLRPWEETLHAYAIQPIQQFAYSKGKNASDIAMVIDALDLLHSGVMDGCAIVSSDADFTPLVMRLRTSGIAVHGFGERKTPEPFVNACSTFTYVDALEQKPDDGGQAARRVPGTELRGDARLVQLLRNAVTASADDDGWAHLSGVRNQIGNQASFDPRNYGYAKFSDLVEASGLFEVRREGLTVYVRPPQPRPAAGGSPATAKKKATKAAAPQKPATKTGATRAQDRR